MKKYVSGLMVALMVMVGANFCFSNQVKADEDEELQEAATSISISPVSKILQLQPSSTYDDSFKVTNNSSSDMPFEVYASPYSYTFSEEEDEYKLGFNNENNYTQITRWITFKDSSGNYVKNPSFNAAPNETVEVFYRISTPNSIPAGGQYAVLFAHTLSSSTISGGIKTEASPGLIVYGRSNGDTIISSNISKLEINQTLEVGKEKKSIINASAKVKNVGNVDFMASGVLKVEGVFGRAYYETPSNQGKISIIPETELTVSDSWDETPFFGFFKVSWTVSAAGKTESITQMILILPPVIIVIMLILLTIIVIWIIITIKKRRERRSRLVV